MKTLAQQTSDQALAASRHWLDHESAHGCAGEKGASGCVLADRLWRNFKALTDLHDELSRPGADESRSEETT